MNPTILNIVQSDVGYNLNFTLQDNAGAAIDLSGATLALKVQLIGATTVKFTGVMAIDVAASGTCHYTVAATDFDVEGRYYAEIVITYPSTEVLTYPNILIVAAPKLPRS